MSQYYTTYRFVEVMFMMLISLYCVSRCPIGQGLSPQGGTTIPSNSQEKISLELLVGAVLKTPSPYSLLLLSLSLSIYVNPFFFDREGRNALLQRSLLERFLFRGQTWRMKNPQFTFFPSRVTYCLSFSVSANWVTCIIVHISAYILGNMNKTLLRLKGDFPCFSYACSIFIWKFLLFLSMRQQGIFSNTF